MIEREPWRHRTASKSFVSSLYPQSPYQHMAKPLNEYKSPSDTREIQLETSNMFYSTQGWTSMAASKTPKSTTASTMSRSEARAKSAAKPSAFFRSTGRDDRRQNHHLRHTDEGLQFNLTY